MKAYEIGVLGWGDLSIGWFDQVLERVKGMGKAVEDVTVGSGEV